MSDSKEEYGDDGGRARGAAGDTTLTGRADLVGLSGMIHTLDFSEVRTGVTFPADAFVFQVPEGVRVIEPGASLGRTVPWPIGSTRARLGSLWMVTWMCSRLWELHSERGDD